MEEKQWIERISSRSDFTSRVTHLTKRTDNKSAFEVLCDILGSKTILGSKKDGCIRNGNKAVCFQDLPLYSLAENVRYEEDLSYSKAKAEKIEFRYEAFGLRFNKGHLFTKGGRPVIYGTETEINNMPEDELWRCVKIDLSNSKNIVDWTHEREWRIKNDLHFEYSEIEAIVGCEKCYREFINRYSDNSLLSEINGIIVLNSLYK